MNDHILDSLDIVSRKHVNLGILLVGDSKLSSMWSFIILEFAFGGSKEQDYE